MSKTTPLIVSAFTLLLILAAVLLMRWLPDYALLVSVGAAALWALGFAYAYGKPPQRPAQDSGPGEQASSLSRLWPRGVALFCMLALIALPMTLPQASMDLFFEPAAGTSVGLRAQGMLIITLACALFFWLGIWAERRR